MSIKQSLHMPTSFSPIHHEHIHISLTLIFHNANTPKIQAKIHPTTSQSTYIVKIPQATNIVRIEPWSKKKQHFKNAPKPTFSNITNHAMPQKFQNNQMTISHHETFNEICNNIFSKQGNQRKNLTLVSTWQYGAWVLGSWRSPSSSC